MTTTLEKVPLDKIYPTTDNARAFDPKSPSFIELRESIANKGQKIPGIGRPHPEIADAIDLRAGRRRLEALRQIGEETMDILIRPMTDVEAVEETVLENFREDLTIYEEAANIGKLIEIGHTREEVADLLGGKSAAWVARRCSLLRLDLSIVAELRDGCGIEPTSAALEVLSRYDSDIQRKVLESLKEEEVAYDFAEKGTATKISEKLMQEFCSEYHQDLDKAPWDLDDVELYKPAGACSACPKRSSCEPLLFNPDEIGGKKDADICLDETCWNNKRSRYFETIARDVSVKTGKEPVVMSDFYGDKDRLGDVNVVRKHEYEKAKKTDAGAIPAIDVAAKDPTRITYVKPRDFADTGGGSGAGGQKKTLTQKREELNKKRELYTVYLLHETFTAALLADLVPIDGVDTPAQLLILALSYGVSLHEWIYDLEELQQDNDVWINTDDYGVAYGYLQESDRYLAAGWIAVRKSIAETISRKGPVSSTHTAEYIEHAKEVASLIGWDWDKGLAEATEEIPEPKAWAKEPAAA